MAPVMQAMAGKSVNERMRALQDLQRSGMLDPGSKGPRVKKGTGKRLTAKERVKLKKQREKELRRKKRSDKGKN